MDKEPFTNSPNTPARKRSKQDGLLVCSPIKTRPKPSLNQDSLSSPTPESTTTLCSKALTLTFPLFPFATPTTAYLSSTAPSHATTDPKSLWL